MNEPLMPDGNPRHELLALAQRMCDGLITVEERDQLEALLRNDRAARDQVRAYLNLHAEMQWYYRGEEQEAALDMPAPSIPITAPGASPKLASPVPSTPVLGFLGRVRSVASRPVVWSVLAVALLFYGGFTVISWNLRSGKLPSGTEGNGLEVARVSDSENLRWSDQSQPRGPKVAIQAGEPLRIESGMVELKLKSGASLLVEAPAEWSIDGANQATLLQGKLVAYVPPQAVGFELTTSKGRVIDLGTEFGVDSQQPVTDVHVFQGRVEVEPKASAGAPAKPRIKLGAGESVRLETSAGSEDVVVEKTTGRKEGFVRSLAEKRSSKESNRYAECVRALKPIVYLPVNEQDGLTLRSDTEGYLGQFARTDGPGEAWEQGPFGDALRFRGTKFTDRVTLEPTDANPDKQALNFSRGKEPAKPFTLTLWARCQPGQNTGTLIGKGAGFQEQYLFDILNGKYRFVTISADRKTVGEISSKTPFDGTWQHAAAVFDPAGKSISLYVNGQQQATSELKDAALFATDETTYIGNRPFRGDDKKLTLDGALDEVAIFNRALTREEIDGLYRLRSSPAPAK